MTGLPYKAVRRDGQTCHFGDRTAAATWAGDYGEVTVVPGAVPEVVAGQWWVDAEGRAEVLGVVAGYAVMKRRRRNPFLASVSVLLRGERWTLEAP